MNVEPRDAPVVGLWPGARRPPPRGVALLGALAAGASGRRREPLPRRRRAADATPQDVGTRVVPRPDSAGLPLPFSPLARLLTPPGRPGAGLAALHVVRRAVEWGPAKSRTVLVRLARLRMCAFSAMTYALFASLPPLTGAERSALSVPRFALGQAVVFTAQLMTHYVGEYFDLAADRAHPAPSPFSGGSRVLVEDGALAATCVEMAAAAGAASVGLAACAPEQAHQTVAVVSWRPAPGQSQWGQVVRPELGD